MRSIGLPEIMAIVGIFVMIPLAAIVVVYLVRRLQAKERLQAIEKGVTVPVAPTDPWERAVGVRERGIGLTAIGLGIIILVWTGSGEFLEAVGVGAIPLLVGLGFLLSYRLRVLDLRARPPAGS